MHPKEQIAGMRFGGLACLLIGGGTTYFNVYQVMELAAHRAPRLSLSSAAVAGPPLLLVGLLCLCFPRFALFHIGKGRQRRSKGVWVFIAVFALSGLAFSLWMEAQLRAYGYQQIFR